MSRILIFIFLVYALIYFSCSPSEDNSKGVVIKGIRSGAKRIVLYEKSYALLIGVSEYKYWPDLRNIPTEMNQLEAALKRHGFIVQNFLNSTSKVLKDKIENFINEYGFNPNNRLLIFFSGHGYTRKDGKKGYIVPADAVNPTDDEIMFAKKAVEMHQILTWAKRIEAKHAMFVFDSCFSGAIFQSKELSNPGYITYLTANPVRQFITAGNANETVPAKSYFVPCFIRGIEGEADYDEDGFITGTELGFYLQKEIIQYNIGQTPQFEKIRDPDLDQGEFVFILKKNDPGDLGNNLKPPQLVAPNDYSNDQFSWIIPLNVIFEAVPEYTRMWFQREIMKPVCINGIYRKIQLTKKGDFQLTISQVRENVYTVKLDSVIIWNSGTIFGDTDMENCIENIINGIKAKIENSFFNSPRYTVSKSLIIIKFLDETLYAFLSEDNFKLHSQRCRNKG